MKRVILSIFTFGLVLNANSQINHQVGSFYYDNPITPATTFSPTATFSTSLGANNTIVGEYSTAKGYFNTVNGYASFASGTYVTSNGSHSQGFGNFLQTDGLQSFTFGSGNLITPFVNAFDKTFAISWDSQTPAFVVRKVNGDQRAGIGTFSPLNKMHIVTGDDQGLSFVSTATNQRSNIEFRDETENLNWDITAYNNFGGGYGNVLEIQSHKGGNLWVHNSTMMIGSSFDLDACTDCSDYLLFVRKGIRTEELKVDIASGAWADYVFDSSYVLMPIEEVETYISENGHLPNVPAAEEVESEGIRLGEMNAKLLEKVEELTLYLIQQKEEIETLKTELEKTNERLSQITKL